MILRRGVFKKDKQIDRFEAKDKFPESPKYETVERNENKNISSICQISIRKCLRIVIARSLNLSKL